MNRRELEMHLQDLFEGRLGGDALQDLQRELRTSPEAQDLYRDYAHLHNALQLRADGIDLLHVVPMDRVIQRRQRRYLRHAVLAAAAVLVVSALVATQDMIGQPEPARLIAVATADSRWTVNGAAQNPGANEWTVVEGSTVQVWSGTVRLRLDSGVAMVMQGPARASFPELDKPVLERGWLWIDSGQGGEAVEVATPELLIRDIGTRFGVRVAEDSPAEVHLIEGKVEVFAKSTQQSIVELEPEEQGVAITMEGELSGRSLAQDPFPELADLLAAPANYPTTVLSQNPVGYWRLDDLDGPAIANEITGGLVGIRETGASPVDAGPSSEAGWHGFGAGNSALRLSGRSRDVPISLGSSPVHGGLLFEEKFRGRGPLHGRRPGVAIAGEKWVAATSPSEFNSDGVFVGRGSKTDLRRGGSATLAFKPVSGLLYTMDVSLREFAGGGYYFAAGFADGQSSKGNKESRFIKGLVSGRVWMCLYTAGGRESAAVLGTTGSNGGLADARPFSSFSKDSPSELDLRIVLDTSGGAGKWTSTWLAKRPVEEDYAVVRPTAELLNESISSVGIAVGGGDVSGRIERFSLRAGVKAPGDAVARLLGSPARISRREGAVSLWFRADASHKSGETLWSAGESALDDSIHARLNDRGEVAFFMENGRYDVLISSEESMVDGRWHHLAASWSPKAVDLYLDGELVGNDTEYRGMQQGILPELRFGSGPAGSKAAPFKGWVDEIGLWDRALTGAEVRHQFQSAGGR